MNAALGRLLPVAAVLICLGCASTGTDLTPVPKTTPKTRAQRVYQSLVERHRPTTSNRTTTTMAGFPEAPSQVSAQLEALARSRQGEEEPAVLALSEALVATGYYSLVTFRTDSAAAKVKYRLIARQRAQAAHDGENKMAIGFYFIWTERDGRITSPVDQYEIIAERLRIYLPEFASERR